MQPDLRCDGYWLRTIVDGRQAGIGEIAALLERNGIPIDGIEQTEWEQKSRAEDARVVWVHTGQTPKAAIRKAVEKIDASSWRDAEIPTVVLPRFEQTSVPDWEGEVS
jgi:hypothetical protein